MARVSTIPGGAVPAMAATTRGFLTALAIALLALAGFVAPLAVAVLVLAGAVAFAFGWSRLVDVPSANGAFRVIALSAAPMVAATYATGTTPLLAVVTALGVIASFVHQMVRRDGRPRLVETVSADLTGIAVVASATGWILAVATDGGVEVLLTAAAALFAASTVTLLRAASRPVATLAVAVAGLVGVVVGALLPEVGLVAGLSLGVVGGAIVSFSHLLFSGFPAAGHRRAAVAAALMPVLSLGVPIHLVAEVIGVAR